MPPASRPRHKWRGGMQELQSAAAALIGSFDAPGQIAQWVARFADISAGSKLSATRLDDMGKAEFTELANAGIPIYQTLAEAGQVLTGIVRPILQALASLLQEYKGVFAFLVGAVTKFLL